MWSLLRRAFCVGDDRLPVTLAAVQTHGHNCNFSIKIHVHVATCNIHVIAGDLQFMTITTLTYVYIKVGLKYSTLVGLLSSLLVPCRDIILCIQCMYPPACECGARASVRRFCKKCQKQD